MTALLLFLALAIDPADVRRITPIVPPRRVSTNTFRATLTVLDPRSVHWTNGVFTFSAGMVVPYRVEWSHDLSNWIPTAIDTAGNGVCMVTASNATNRVGFFRLRELPMAWKAAPPWNLDRAPSGSTQKVKATP